MIRVKTFNATGVAPDGRLYAGDLNAIQDAAAGLADFTQTHDVNTLRVGDSAIQLLKFGTLDARVTAALRVDGILRGLGGLYAGAFTTAQRNAIAAGFRPLGLIIFNTDTLRHEVNIGSDASPNWQNVAPTLGTNSITATELADNAVDNAAMQDNSVGSNEIIDGSVGNAELADNSVSLSKMQDNSVGTAEIVADSVTQAKMADNSVGSNEIVDGNVGTAELGANVVTPGKAAIDATQTWNFLGILQSKTMRAHRHPYANDRHIEGGTVAQGANLNNSTYYTYAITFTDAFASAPAVTVGLDSAAGDQSTGKVHGRTTSGGTVATYNVTNGTNINGIHWIAEGQD